MRAFATIASFTPNARLTLVSVPLLNAMACASLAGTHLTVEQQIEALGGQVVSVQFNADGSEQLQPAAPLEQTVPDHDSLLETRSGIKVTFKAQASAEPLFVPPGLSDVELLRRQAILAIERAFATASFGDQDIQLLDKVDNLRIVDFTNSAVTPYAVTLFAASHKQIQVHFDWFIGIEDLNDDGWIVVHTSACDLELQHLCTDSGRCEVAVWSPKESAVIESQMTLGVNDNVSVRFRSDSKSLSIVVRGKTFLIDADGKWLKFRGNHYDLRGKKRRLALGDGELQVVTE